MSRLFAIAALALGLFLGGAPAGAVEEDQQAISVVELFTSQGCNSCPPADRLLNRMAQDPEILALSWNVDYWDYMGWNDTLAKASHSQRQLAYNKQIGRRGVYTPQMIINGRAQCIGSDKEALEAVLQSEDAGAVLPLDLKPLNDYLVVSLDKDSQVNKAVVILIQYEPQVSVPVQGGENIGRVLTYTNVVTNHEVVGEWDGNNARIMVERDRLGPKGNAILVQQKNAQGPILRAAIVEAASD